ncbi:MAG: hypothetical protein JWP20_2117, partial [Roseomonas sp.]|nr:hypothetical protein [Roseomonas sp.]
QLRPAEEPPLPAGAAAAVVPGGAAAFLGLAPRWTPEGGGLLWWADALAAELRCVTGGRIEPVAPWNAALRGLAPAAGARPEVLAFDALGAATRIGQDGTQRARRVLPAAPLVVRTHPGGALWAAMEKDGASMIGPLRPDGTLSPAWRLPGHVRALAWAAGGRALYAATPDTGCIHRLEDGRAAPLLLARMPSGAGRPAGLAVDADGGLWVALHDGWSVARLGHDGEVERVLPLPVPRPTDLGFGGPGLATLYIATARDGLGFDTLAAAPLSGRLLTAMPGVQGLPEAPSDWL